MLAAACTKRCAESVINSNINSAFALIRPPGHHACINKVMGFSFFNNIALAALYLKQEYNLKRICVFDWDIHHGNGTQEILKNKEGILYCSIHRFDHGNFYPGTGTHLNNFNNIINMPLNTDEEIKPHDIGDNEYIFALNNLFIPIIKQYEPEIILVSAGFDAARDDPIGNFDLTPMGYAYMTKALKNLSNIVLVLEGGYSENNK